MSSLADVTVYQGADVASDYHMLVTSMNVTLRGGATVLKVGGKNFFYPPHFLASGGGDKILLR